MGEGPNRRQLYGLALREASHALRRRAFWLTRMVRLRVPAPERLLFAPQDLRTSDPSIATDIYGGLFVFAGRAVSAGGRSPFLIEAPTPRWGEALYGFGWLRHLRAADTTLARVNARALLDEFLSTRLSPANQRIARRTEVVARRLISLLGHSPLLLTGADHDAYRRVMRAVGHAVRDLDRNMREGAMPYPRLMAAIALCYAGLCCGGSEALLRRASKALVVELERQILPDGGHASRNPQVLIDLLLDLLPLRQVFASRGLEAPPELVRAVERMLPMLRLFRHGDGMLAQFNGMAVTPIDHLATLLSYDEVRARAMQRGPDSGYERIEANRTLLIADTGAPPPVAHSRSAHAGCLSFELSSGVHHVVVNCGAPPGGAEPATQLARTTPAHATVTLGGTSSCVFLAEQEGWLDRRVSSWLLRRLGPIVLDGPHKVEAERSEDESGIRLAASHDGYRAACGLVHERRWRVMAGGDVVEGEDSFLFDEAGSSTDQATIRFHLHPSVRASRVQAGQVVMLVLPNREAWQFTSQDVEPALEESIFFAAVDGKRRTEQIVLTLNPRNAGRVSWRFERLARESGRRTPETELPDLLF